MYRFSLAIISLIGILYLCFANSNKPEHPMSSSEKHPFTKQPETFSDFKTKQLSFETVKQAYAEKEQHMGRILQRQGIDGDFEIFLRVFKQERILEVWARSKGSLQFQHLIDYPFCNFSGDLGPKRIQGDAQIPEGVYFLDVFNPLSSYFLSMRVNYPNASDRILSDSQKPGGDIYFHGGCATVGCIPITDDKIKELYLLAVEAKDGGQEQIPVHQFPFRMTKEVLKKANEKYPAELLEFWDNLAEVYLFFEQQHTLAPTSVNSKGAYYIKP